MDFVWCLSLQALLPLHAYFISWRTHCVETFDEQEWSAKFKCDPLWKVHGFQTMARTSQSSYLPPKKTIIWKKERSREFLTIFQPPTRWKGLFLSFPVEYSSIIPSPNCEAHWSLFRVVLQTLLTVNDVVPKFTGDKGKWPLEPLYNFSTPIASQNSKIWVLEAKSLIPRDLGKTSHSQFQRFVSHPKRENESNK